MVDIKKQYEKAAEPLTAKDKNYVDTTDGGVPVTKAEQIIEKEWSPLLRLFKHLFSY